MDEIIPHVCPGVDGNCGELNKEFETIEEGEGGGGKVLNFLYTLFYYIYF